MQTKLFSFLEGNKNKFDFYFFSQNIQSPLSLDIIYEIIKSSLKSDKNKDVLGFSLKLGDYVELILLDENEQQKKRVFQYKGFFKDKEKYSDVVILSDIKSSQNEPAEWYFSNKIIDRLTKVGVNHKINKKNLISNKQISRHAIKGDIKVNNNLTKLLSEIGLSIQEFNSAGKTKIILLLNKGILKLATKKITLDTFLELFSVGDVDFDGQKMTIRDLGRAHRQKSEKDVNNDIFIVKNVDELKKLVKAYENHKFLLISDKFKDISDFDLTGGDQFFRTSANLSSLVFPRHLQFQELLNEMDRQFTTIVEVFKPDVLENFFALNLVRDEAVESCFDKLYRSTRINSLNEHIQVNLSRILYKLISTRSCDEVKKIDIPDYIKHSYPDLEELKQLLQSKHPLQDYSQSITVDKFKLPKLLTEILLLEQKQVKIENYILLPIYRSLINQYNYILNKINSYIKNYKIYFNANVTEYNLLNTIDNNRINTYELFNKITLLDYNPNEATIPQAQLSDIKKVKQFILMDENSNYFRAYFTSGTRLLIDDDTGLKQIKRDSVEIESILVFVGTDPITDIRINYPDIFFTSILNKDEVEETIFRWKRMLFSHFVKDDSEIRRKVNELRDYLIAENITINKQQIRNWVLDESTTLPRNLREILNFLLVSGYEKDLKEETINRIITLCENVNKRARSVGKLIKKIARGGLTKNDFKATQDYKELNELGKQMVDKIMDNIKFLTVIEIAQGEEEREASSSNKLIEIE